MPLTILVNSLDSPQSMQDISQAAKNSTQLIPADSLFIVSVIVILLRYLLQQLKVVVEGSVSFLLDFEVWDCRNLAGTSAYWPWPLQIQFLLKLCLPMIVLQEVFAYCA